MNDGFYTHMKPIKIFSLFLTFFAFLSYFPIKAQEKPPRPIAVYIYQNLNFGALATGISGGSVIMDAYGTRSPSGTITLFYSGWPYFPAIFEIEGNPGTVVHCLPQSGSITLTGSPSGSLTIMLGQPIPMDPIILNTTPPSRTQVKFGGKLTVSGPATNPPGIYTGTFYVIFV